MEYRIGGLQEVVQEIEDRRLRTGEDEGRSKPERGTVTALNVPLGIPKSVYMMMDGGNYVCVLFCSSTAQLQLLPSSCDTPDRCSPSTATGGEETWGHHPPRIGSR